MGQSADPHTVKLVKQISDSVRNNDPGAMKVSHASPWCHVMPHH